MASKKIRRKKFLIILLAILLILIILDAFVLFYFLYYLPNNSQPEFTEITRLTLDGGYGLADSAVGLVYDEQNKILFVTGYITIPGEGMNIWLGKLDKEFNLLETTIIAGPTSGEDKGYGLVIDESDRIFVVGTMTETGEGYNLWLAEFNTELHLQNSVTIDDPINGEDVAYTIIQYNNYLYLTGCYTEFSGNGNILLAIFDKNLEMILQKTISGIGNFYDSGFGLITFNINGLFVSGFMTSEISLQDIWLAQFTI